MGLIDRAASWLTRAANDPTPSISMGQVLEMFSFNGNSYLVGGLQQTLQGHAEEIGNGFDSLIQMAYRTNAVVFACELARMQLFSEARFQFQELRDGRPGKLFGNRTLEILEHPWPTGITGDLLVRALLDADFGGTAFNVRRGSTIRRLRPDWVTMVIGSEHDVNVVAGDIDADLLGVMYHPGGRGTGREPEFILRESLSVFAPIPDPLATYRGMPWVLPVINEIIADKQMTAHKSAYLVNGATPNMTVAIDKDLKEAANPKAFAEWVEAFKKTNPTTSQFDRYKTWYLAGGTVVTKVGSDLKEADFKQVQGAGETRIAAAAGVPPVIVGLSEGLQAATYSNYGQARRRFADNTMRPLWRNMAGSLETIVKPPTGSRLWYDDRDIQALAEDKKDLAEVRALEAQQIRTLNDAGFTPETVVEAVTAGDFTRLVHSNLFSVQLQPPGTPAPEPKAPLELPPSTNGTNGKTPEKAPAGRSDLLEYLLSRRAGEPDYLFTRYSPDQPRVPAGSGDDGGEWTDGSATGGDPFAGRSDASAELAQRIRETAAAKAAGDWPDTKPWEASGEDIKAGKVPGLSASQGGGGGNEILGYADYAGSGTIKINIDRWESMPVAERIPLLYHELGHFATASALSDQHIRGKLLDAMRAGSEDRRSPGEALANGYARVVTSHPGRDMDAGELVPIPSEVKMWQMFAAEARHVGLPSTVQVDLYPQRSKDYWFRYSPDQPRVPKGNPQGGEFGYPGGRPGLESGPLVEQAQAGGFSVTRHGDVPAGGYMVSPYPQAERKYSASTLTREDVKAYREAHADLLAKPDHYLGGWRDGDTIYLDVSIHTATSSKAAKLAKQFDQLAYFDLKTGTSVYLEPAPVQ